MKHPHRLTSRFAFLFSLLLPICAAAHDTWLLPVNFAPNPGTEIDFDMSSGMAFPTPLNAIKPDRIAQAGLRLGGQQLALADTTLTAQALRLKTRLTTAGIAVAWVELKPRAIALSTKQVREYLHEIGADAALRAEWNRASHPKHWRELYSKHAKSFVRVGPGTTDATAWAEPVGLALEIVPDTDPTDLKVGDSLSLRILRDGQALPQFAVGLVHAGASAHQGQLAHTDSQGRVTFHLNRPGRWLVRSTELRQSSRPDTDWESHFTTLTLHVQQTPKTDPAPRQSAP